jgi:hypothetical protein
MTTENSSATDFISALKRGENWFPCLLKVISQWTQPTETWKNRRYAYLIGQEAFDWLLLAERLLDDTDDLILSKEKEDLLFNGKPPIPMTSNLFREMIGPHKYRAHLNFLYGVIVEQALQQLTLEEFTKGTQNQISREEQLEQSTFESLYNSPRELLYSEFREAMVGTQMEHSPIEEHNSFTYWLFKKRVKLADPSRLASDTLKGIRTFSTINPDFWNWSQGENENYYGI